MTTTQIRPGLYRHYKGARYRVFGLARHSETEEPMVVYQALYGEHGLWVRPAAMFAETVEVDGRSVPRFAFEADAPSLTDLADTEF
jgi:hypothetical protein